MGHGSDRLRRHARRRCAPMPRSARSGWRSERRRPPRPCCRRWDSDRRGPRPRIERTFFFLSRRLGRSFQREESPMSATYEAARRRRRHHAEQPAGQRPRLRRPGCGIVDGLDQALADAAVKAIVVTGAGKAFSGGADIREFGSPKAIAEPNLLLGDRCARGEHQAGRRRDAQRRDGRRPRAGARLPLPRRRAAARRSRCPK